MKKNKKVELLSNNVLDLALIPGDGIGPEVTAEDQSAQSRHW